MAIVGKRRGQAIVRGLNNTVERRRSVFFFLLYRFQKASNPKRSQIRPNERLVYDWDFLLHSVYNSGLLVSLKDEVISLWLACYILTDLTSGIHMCKFKFLESHTFQITYFIVSDFFFFLSTESGFLLSRLLKRPVLRGYGPTSLQCCSCSLSSTAGAVLMLCSTTTQPVA